MKKALIPALALGMVAILSACNSSGAAQWEKGVNINYALLIGQIDHNDSAARTAGIRDALGTRGTKLTNANQESPVTGKLTIAGKDYTITEVEHGEQKATGGATWDQATATSTAQTWISKHANDTWKSGDSTVKSQGINLFVSNNDGMAVGAIGASNWVSGMPIFGYDSNADALTFIKEGKIMGTINQDASAQAAGILMAVRNAMDGKTGKDVYESGFSKDKANDFGYVSSTFAYEGRADLKDSHALLVNNFAITAANVAQYEGKAPADLIETTITKPETSVKKTIFMNTYSATDTFLKSTVNPLMDLYKDKFNLAYSRIEGNGNDDTTVLNAIGSNAACDGYVVNMVKTASTKLYLDKIASKVGASETSKSNVPVIFWNRQGTTEDGAVDTTVMNDSRFSTILYVGFDAIQGGQLQGSMVKDYITANIANLTK